MRVLVDTSVWSLALRRKSPSRAPQAETLEDLILSGQSIFITGIILTEILQSVRHDQLFSKIKRQLDAFPCLELGRQGYSDAADLGSTCRRKGIQVSTVDLVIAQTAIAHNTYLLTADSDFGHIAKHSTLTLL